MCEKVTFLHMGFESQQTTHSPDGHEINIDGPHASEWRVGGVTCKGENMYDIRGYATQRPPRPCPGRCPADRAALAVFPFASARAQPLFACPVHAHGIAQHPTQAVVAWKAVV